MGQKNVLLVRYLNGYAAAIDNSFRDEGGAGRKEAFLKLGNVESLAVVQRVAEEWFSIHSHPFEESNIGIDPNSVSRMPGVGYGLGDIITTPANDGGTSTKRVRGFAVTVDDDTAAPRFTPTLEDVTAVSDRIITIPTLGTGGGGR